jgi:hypothetical protein
MLRALRLPEPVVLAPFFAPRVTAMRVPDELRKCILFVGIKDKDGNFLPRASAFFAKIIEHQHEWVFVITAQHVVSGLLLANHEIWIRNNKKGGGTTESKIPADKWIYGVTSPDRLDTDVAACSVQITPDEDVMGVGLNGPQSMTITDEDIINHEIGIGDEVHIAGLFRSHFGRQNNVPIIRIGNIAMMGGEPVWTRYCGYVEAHLIEAMSIGGLSGSPVFVNLGPVRIKNSMVTQTAGRPYLFFGMMHGHFDVKNLNEDVVSDDETTASKGLHTGIGVVIPARKIIETVFQQDQSEMRRKLIESHRNESGAVADAVTERSDSSDVSEKGANPNHLKDYREGRNGPAASPASLRNGWPATT